MWSTPIDLYCERLDPSFWAEPVNAISNVAFLVAAGTAYWIWRTEHGDDRAVLALIVVAAVVGLGSFTFHTLATRGAMLLDVGPIGVFIFGYVLLALRRFLALPWLAALLVFAGFAALSVGLAVWVPRTILSGSIGYFPAQVALFVIGWLTRKRPLGHTLLAAGPVFAMSVALRHRRPATVRRVSARHAFPVAYPQCHRDLSRATRRNPRSTPSGLTFKARHRARRCLRSSAPACGR